MNLGMKNNGLSIGVEPNLPSIFIVSGHLLKITYPA